MQIELFLGGEGRLNMVVAPVSASTLWSLFVVCEDTKLFSPASCSGELPFDLAHVA